MISPALHRLLAEARAVELARASRASRVAAGGRRAARRRVRAETPVAIGREAAITIRYAFPDDTLALVRLAELDSRQLPSGPILVAEVEGELRAAMSIRGGEFIADPFHRTAALLDLLATRARQCSAATDGARVPRLRAAPIARLTGD